MNKKLIAFDIWGDYGYFRRGYTSTSTITYPFPSRTTIAGLISGILGLEKDSYHDIFSENNSKLGLRILNPIKKININLNYINTKEGFLLSDINPAIDFGGIRFFSVGNQGTVLRLQLRAIAEDQRDQKQNNARNDPGKAAGISDFFGA